MEENKKIQWHPGFYAGLEFELRKYRDNLTFEPEHVLSNEPVRLDMLVIKKAEGLIIDNPIGRLFRKHNVIEYKSPEDGLSIDDFYKTIGYGCFYKGYGVTVNAIDANDMTISIFRHTYPRQLFSDLHKLGAKVVVKYPGVYYINGVINLPMQIVVIGELEDDCCHALRILANNAKESDIRKFIAESSEVDVQADRYNVDAILQVSVSANSSLYEKIRRETAMCEALRELMKDEIEADVEKAVGEAVEKTERETRIKTRFEDGMPIELIAEKSNVSIEVVNEVLEESGMLTAAK